MPLLVLAGFVSWCAWAVMVAVGVLHSAGVVDRTLGYDQCSALAWLVIPPVLFVLGAALRAVVSALDDGE
jgi:ABC-type uncharacterized transport system YnjBCD permease subunit